VAASVYSTPADAQLFHDFSRSVVRDFKRNNCWPDPFQATDRVAVRAPFNVMVHNGWQRQNMIGDLHFDETGKQLSKAGETKVRWILTETPPHHRTIYVHRGESTEDTDTRIAAVHNFAESILPEGQTSVVHQTDIDREGLSAERVSTIIRKFHETTPPPVIPPTERYSIAN
jgi:hypothetical protein